MAKNFYIEILETNKQIERLIMKSIIDEVNTRFPRLVTNITRKLRQETFVYLVNTPTLESLVRGELAGHFGLPAGVRHDMLNKILLTIANNIQVEYKPIKKRGTKYSNGLKIEVLLASFDDILSLPQAAVISEDGEFLVDWLAWLLTAGDKVIVREYDFEVDFGEGRSGFGIMIPETAGAWRVPPEFSGTKRNNWLTRAILDPAYSSIIENILKRELS
jgi:hypothetical protein